MTSHRRIIEAKYHESPIRLYRGNPLIEALPAIMSPEDVYQELRYAPELPTAAERHMPAHLRVHLLHTLRLLVLPLNDYIKFEPMFSMMLRGGYILRAPSAESWRKTYQLASYKHISYEIPAGTRSSAYGALLYGLSGLGKSTLIDQILAKLPEAIIHYDFDGPGSRWTQIVFVKINAPPNGSVVGLCKAILTEIARIVGDPSIGQRWTGMKVPDYLSAIAALARSYCIGVIILDELHQLKQGTEESKQVILNFFTNLIENVGIPILGIGTYSIETMFRNVFKTVRKAGGIGTHEFYRPYGPDDEQWQDLVKFVWEYQWLKAFQTLTPALRKELYFQAVGIPDVLVKLYILLQIHAMFSESEKISVNLMREIAKNELKLLQPALNILRRASFQKLRPEDAIRFDDLFPQGDWFDNVLNEVLTKRGKTKVDKSEEKASDIRAASTTTGDSSAVVPDLRKHIVDIKNAYQTLGEAGLVVSTLDDLY